MAYTRTLWLLPLALSALLLIVSADISTSTTATKESSESTQYGGSGYSGYSGGGRDGYPKGVRGGYWTGGRGGYQGGRRGGCPNGCYRRYRDSDGCNRRCAYADEAPDAFFADDKAN